MWTRLAQTVNSGSSTITLQQSVDWETGDEIVISSTGDKFSQKENEQRTIQSVSGDGLTLTLNKPLEYKHLGETKTITGAYTIELRAEVGLLSHNVIVRGSDNDAWHDKIEACPDGFDPGEHFLSIKVGYNII